MVFERDAQWRRIVDVPSPVSLPRMGEGAQPVRHSLLDACCGTLERDVGSSCAADREDAIPPHPGRHIASRFFL